MHLYPSERNMDKCIVIWQAWTRGLFLNLGWKMRFSCIFHKIWEAYEILSYSWHSKLSKMVNKIRWDRWFRSYEFKKKWTFFAHNFWLNHTLEKIETLHRSEFNFLSFSPYRNSLNASCFPSNNISCPRAVIEISFLAGNLTRRASLSSLWYWE